MIVTLTADLCCMQLAQVLRHGPRPAGGHRGRHAGGGRRGDDRAALPRGVRQQRRRGRPGHLVGGGGRRRQGVPDQLLAVSRVSPTLVANIGFLIKFVYKIL